MGTTTVLRMVACLVQHQPPSSNAATCGSNVCECSMYTYSCVHVNSHPKDLESVTPNACCRWTRKLALLTPLHDWICIASAFMGALQARCISLQVPWAVTANMAIRNLGGVEFDLRFPKTGGGEDIVFCLRVAGLQRLVAVPEVCMPLLGCVYPVRVHVYVCWC